MDGSDFACSSTSSASSYIVDYGKRYLVDIVMAYKNDEGDDSEKAECKRRIRKHFEDFLVLAGFICENIPPESSVTGQIGFLKIHGEIQALMRCAEESRIKMPLRTGEKPAIQTETWLEKYIHKDPFLLSDEAAALDMRTIRYTTEFQLGRLSSFKSAASDPENDNFFSVTQRIYLMWTILNKIEIKLPALNPEDSPIVISGIRHLLRTQTYIGAYPIHDGGKKDFRKQKDSEVKPPLKEWNIRRQLMRIWGSLRSMFKYQPLWLIKSYFGVHVAMYFAWIGHYTGLLVWPSIVGVIWFFIGIGFANDRSVQDICDGKRDGNKIMCPVCPPPHCHFWKLSTGCTWYKLSRIFSNDYVPILALFVLIWGEISLRTWKRKEVELNWEWVATNREVEYKEEICLSYEQVAKKQQKKKGSDSESSTSMAVEKDFRKNRRLLSYVMLVLMILLVLFVNFGLLILHVVFLMQGYKIFNNQTLNLNVPFGKRDDGIFLAQFFISRTYAACIYSFVSLIIIIVFTVIYRQVAKVMTMYECPRTMSTYESSYAIKMSVFQICNYIVPICYIAFFKDRIPKYEGDKIGWWILKIPESCGPGGCITDVLIQVVATLFIGQICETIYFHFIWPRGLKFWNYREIWLLGKKRRKPQYRWEKDYYLIEYDELYLVEVYVAKIVQGSATNYMTSVVDIHLCDYRRPIPHWYETIGTWQGIMKGMNRAAVFLNGLIIAFSSDLVPRWIYFFEKGSVNLQGYIKDSLTAFSTVKANSSQFSSSVCYYRTHHESNCSLHAMDKCDLNAAGWKTVTVKLIVFIVFCAIVKISYKVLDYKIQPIPQEVDMSIHREHELGREALMEKRVAEQKGKKSHSNSPEDDESTETADRTGTDSAKGTFRCRRLYF